MGNVQVWPFYVVPFIKGYMTLVLVPYVWVPAAALMLASPWWPGPVMATFYILLWLPTRIMLSRDFEWMSVWCWTSAPLSPFFHLQLPRPITLASKGLSCIGNGSWVRDAGLTMFSVLPAGLLLQLVAFADPHARESLHGWAKKTQQKSE